MAIMGEKRNEEMALGLNLKKRDCKKDVGSDEIKLLTRTLKKEDARMRTELRSESIGEIL